jgi:GDP-4-dehydro-6-deoxy-D-mannose reductase
MNGPVLVTGAAGFAGRHLVDSLAADDIPTIGWWNPGGTPPPESASRAVRYLPVNILDRARVAVAIRDINPSAIYHCAGAAHLGRSWTVTTDTYELNVRGTLHVLEGARAPASAPRILIPGSATVYAPSTTEIGEDHELRPSSPYGLSKLAQEMLARKAFNDFGQHVVVARAFNHVGPRQSHDYAASSFARQIARIEAGVAPPVVEVGNLDARRDLTDVRDTVQAYRAILERGRPGGVYNVCSGRAWSLADVLRLLVGFAGVAVEIRPSADRMRPSDTPVVVGDGSRLARELGWAPSIPFEQTLRDLLDDWRRRVQADADRESALSR